MTVLARLKSTGELIVFTKVTVDDTLSSYDGDLLLQRVGTTKLTIGSAGATFANAVTAPSFVGSLSGNASTASKWQTPRTLSFGGDLSGSVILDGSTDVNLDATVLSGTATSADVANKLSAPRAIGMIGDVTGSSNFDGSGDCMITATVVDDSHTHTNATITSIDWSKITTGKPNSLAGYGILDGASSSHTHDSRYLQLSGGSLTGDTTFSVDDKGLGFYGGARIYKKTGAGLRLRTHTSADTTGIIFEDASGTNVRFQVKTDGSADGILFNGNKVWHEGNDGAASGLDADKLDGMQADIAATGSTIVARNANGDFSAGTITATLSGNATTATSAGKWTTARTITLGTDLTGNVSIDGSANVTLNATIVEANIDHGSIGGLGDDDHTQYLNNTRHDTTTRHTLGTVVPHDTLANLTDTTITTPASNHVLYYDNATSKWKNSGQTIIDHGSISGLADDDHTNYLNTTRHDTTTRHGSSVVDHGSIGGLTDDDHSQYLNTTRHDTTARHGSGVVDHGSIGGLGDDDHSQYLNTTRHDTTSRHGSSVVDHGSIGGLSDDDHTIYIKADGTRAFTSTVSGVVPTIGAHLATKDYVDTKLQGLDWQESVLDKDLSVPPATPNLGDRYIINPTGTGAWAGHDNQIAEWAGLSWTFTVLDKGTAVYVEDENMQYTWNNTSWVNFGSTTNHNATSGLQGGIANQYYHLNATEYADITDNGDCTIHYHTTDRNLSNATGTLAVGKGGTGLTTIAANNILYTSSADTLAITSITAFGRSLIDDADNTAARTTLGLGNSATLNTGTTGTTVALGNHTHTFASITDKPTTLLGYGITDAALSTHSHTISDVTDLQTTLDSKASSSHTHLSADLPYFSDINRRTLTGTTTSASYFTFAQTAINPTNYFAHFQIIVTSPTTTIGQTMDVWIYGHGEAAPVIHVFSHQKSTTAATTGLYNIRVAYPKTLNNGYAVLVELNANNTTQRDITIQLLDSNNVNLLSSLTASAYNSTYQSLVTRAVNIKGSAISDSYTGSFSGSLSGNASSATYATSLYNSTWTAGEALVANDIIFLSPADNKWYKVNTSGRNIGLGSIIGRCASAYALNASVGAYLQGYYSLPSGLGTIVLGKDIYVRGTISGNNLVSDGTVTTELTAGYSYLRLGSCVNSTAHINYDGNLRVYTVNNSGVSHVEGMKLDADTLDSMNSDSANTASTIVARDSSGNFSAGTITAALTGNVTGNADTATKLATARNIALTGDVTGNANFDGSGNISIATALDAMMKVRTGSGNYAGLGGYTQISLTNATNYNIVVSSNGSPGGDLGEVWIVKEPSCFKVYNSGSATSLFDYTIVPYTVQGMLTGNGSMAGLSNFTQINFTDLGTTSYTIDIIPTQATDGKVGEFWVIKSTNNFKIYNTGSYVGTFDYTIFY